ncbi:methionyl-tRNA formyltransferase [Syntrophomonas palmitatica]|uniref:methionyl-tRNA formyltransferase n=1 Tax=Syntrophomonas palmitatica TaxID=402877 RepID=UPI0006CFBFA4|nr:methionyl-tRNA formyltransferase [Syntrophomonas palmitatica]
MNIIFMGTSNFAVPSLQALVQADISIPMVVTQPDRPRGRGGKMTPTPVKQAAEDYGITVFQPERIKDPKAINIVCDLKPDLIAVVSYGQIIPGELLKYPAYGCVNVHGSLLPAYRGAAPIQRAMMAGEKETGITIMYMDEGLDTGDIILQSVIPIEDGIDHGNLENIMASKGAALLMEAIKKLQNGTAPRIQQDNSRATYAHRLTREDEKINWQLPAANLHNLIRALSPAPRLRQIKDTKIKIYRSRVVDQELAGKPGEILEIHDHDFWVKTGNGILEILELQREGKRRMAVKEFLQGFPLPKGASFH